MQKRRLLNREIGSVVIELKNTPERSQVEEPEDLAERLSNLWRDEFEFDADLDLDFDLPESRR